MKPWYPLSVPTLGDEEVDAATEVLRSGRTTMGDRVEQFEEAFASRVGATHAVMVNSGSSADLLMAFASKHWKPPGRVILSAVTWPTHVWAWHVAGYNIQFVDVDGLNVSQLAINRVGIIPTDMISIVHLMGIPCRVEANCRFTEDCCEALSSDVGRQGEMATWSFFFSHHMTTMEGGMITTDDYDVASLLRSLRSHGWARHAGGDPYEFVTMGFNVRPTEVAAAIGLVQLNRVEEFNKLRAENYRVFTEMLAGHGKVELPVVPDGVVPFGLPMFVESPKLLADKLKTAGVETRPILGGNLLRQPAFKQWKGEFPEADKVHKKGIYVGLHPTADCGVDEVARLIGSFTA